MVFSKSFHEKFSISTHVYCCSFVFRDNDMIWECQNLKIAIVTQNWPDSPSENWRSPPYVQSLLKTTSWFQVLFKCPPHPTKTIGGHMRHTDLCRPGARTPTDDFVVGPPTLHGKTDQFRDPMSQHISEPE